ncbi:SPFH domain-containing protein [Kitasatospora sp. HPMI-4]|uniref:SPFH domain-containing protein n=1 Tax=Kitasatospora sp. HPMI-4 TaxID=3448443 RepID=UPI003F199368
MGATQFRRAVAGAVARPLAKAAPVPVEDELEAADTRLPAWYPATADADSHRKPVGASGVPRPPAPGLPVQPSDPPDTRDTSTPAFPAVPAMAFPDAPRETHPALPDAPTETHPALPAALAMAGPDAQGEPHPARPDVPAEPHPARRPPRADQALREHRARSLPGWIALLVLLVSVAALLLLLSRTGVLPRIPVLPDLRSAAVRADGHIVMGVGAVAAACAAWLLAASVVCGLLANGGGQSRVLTRWGRYRGTVRRAGLVWVNPLLRRRVVDVRLRHWRSDPVRVTDRTGTPIVVRLLIVWRVRDTARAALAVADHEMYLREQVHAVLSRTASALPCDSDLMPGPALRDGQWFADELTKALAAEAAPIGIEVYSVQPLALDYAPEVAESMRRRRLADLDAGLRTALVDDAVEAAALAVRRLELATAYELDERTRHALMEQLLVAFVAPAGVTASVPRPAVR